MEYETMNRAELEAALRSWAQRNPSEMSRAELAEWNAAMACYDEMNAED